MTKRRSPLPASGRGFFSVCSARNLLRDLSGIQGVRRFSSSRHAPRGARCISPHPKLWTTGCPHGFTKAITAEDAAGASAVVRGKGVNPAPPNPTLPATEQWVGEVLATVVDRCMVSLDRYCDELRQRQRLVATWRTIEHLSKKPARLQPK